MSQPALSLKDWLLVSIILGVLFSLTLSSYLSRNSPIVDEGEPISLRKSEWITVSIQGAVNHPGSYQIERGATCQTLIDLAQPLAVADLSQIQWEKKLRKNQTLLIPEKGNILIFIEGAVQNPGPLNIPLDSKISDLKKYITFLPDAEIYFLKSRRKLKQGETIFIPVKSSQLE